jgi:ADP-ribose pyrophosphatase YjhB (NUDIX family)
VVTNDAGEVLVVSQRGTSWSLPKGHIDPGEDALAAARREIFEESGVRDLELVRELGSYERYKIAVDGGDDRSERKVITMFLFRTREKLLKPVDRDNPEARWVERSKVPLLLTHERDKEFFRGVEF